MPGQDKKLKEQQKENIKRIINQWAPKESYDPVHLNVAKASSGLAACIVTSDLLVTGGSLFLLISTLPLSLTKLGISSISRDRLTNSSGQKLELSFQARIAVQRMERSIIQSFDKSAKLNSKESRELTKQSIAKITDDLNLVLTTASMNKKDKNYLINIQNKDLTITEVKDLEITNNKKHRKTITSFGV